MNNENKNQKPLTLDALIVYTQEVLLPAMDERFATKTEFQDLRTEFQDLRTEFQDFKNESLVNQDATLKKLDTLLTEKTVREYQEKKEKKLWAIVISALKEHRILSSGELEQIAQLEIF